jgi:hypothetical protein
VTGSRQPGQHLARSHPPGVTLAFQNLFEEVSIARVFALRRALGHRAVEIGQSLQSQLLRQRGDPFVLQRAHDDPYRSPPAGGPSRVPWFGKSRRSSVPATTLLRAGLSPGSRIAEGDRHNRRTASLRPGSGPRNARLAWDGDAGPLMRRHLSAAYRRPRGDADSRARPCAPHRCRGCAPIARHRRQEASATWRAR